MIRTAYGPSVNIGVNVNGKTIKFNADQNKAMSYVRGMPPTFVIDDSNATVSFISVNLNPTSKDYRLNDTIRALNNLVQNPYEATQFKMPNRLVQPQETFESKSGMAMRVGGQQPPPVKGKGPPKGPPPPNIVDLMMKLTYQGVRVRNGREEAILTVAGTLQSRKMKDRSLGDITGKIGFDIAGGYVSMAKLRIFAESEFSIPGAGTFRESQTQDIDLDRAAGNLKGLALRAEPPPPNKDVGPGKTLLTQNSSLAATDPVDMKGKNAAARMKAFPVALEAGKTYVISMNSDAIDSYLRLENPGGATVAEDDDSGGGLNARITYRATDTGMHRIICTAFDGKFGPFQLTVQELGTPKTNPKTMPIGTPVPNAAPQPKAPAATPGKTTVDLIPLIDPSRDPIHGLWFVGNNILHCNHMHFRPRLQIPYQPPAEYDYVVTFSQPKQRNGISLIVPNPNGGSSVWTVAHNNGKSYGFHLNGRQDAKPLPTPIADNSTHTTVLQVRRDSLTALLDGVVVATQKSDFRDLVTADGFFKIPSTTLLGLACDDPTVFHYVQVVEITGAGVKTLDNPKGKAENPPSKGNFTMPAKSDQPTSYLKIVSSPGDRIGQGKTYDYTGDMFTAKPTARGIQVSVGGWNLHIGAPNGQTLKVGEYLDAKRFAFSGPSPGLDFYGNGRGSNSLSGEFVVWELEIDGDRIVRLAIDFVQRSEGKGAPLTGKLRVNSTLQ